MERKVETTEADLKKRALSEAGITYSASAALPVILSLVLSIILMSISGGKEQNWYAKQDWYKYLCYLIPQICFAASAFFFFRRSGVSFKGAFGGCKWYYFPIAIALQFGLLFSLSELNEYFVKLLELTGYRRMESTLPTLSGWNLLPAILVIAVLPAVFEETIFRGILSRQMHESGWGILSVVLISGGMFSLFHHNPEQTTYQFLCGGCLTLVALRAGSALPTIVAHFLNNALILILSAVNAPKYGENFSMSQTMPAGGYAALCVCSAICLLGALAFLIFFCGEKGEKKGGVVHGKAFFFASSVGFALCGIQWIITLITGFVAA